MEEFAGFFEEYRRIWEAAIAAGDASALTPFFHVPYLALGADGAATLSSNEAEIRRFNQSRMDLFIKDRAVRWAFRGCDVLTLGTQSAFVTINWEGYRADGSIARAWRHYYNLARTNAGLKILLSTFSAGSS